MFGCPVSSSVEATSSTGAALGFTPPTANDTVDTSVNITCTPSSASVQAIGTHSVSCQGQDDSGNVATCSAFNVTVQGMYVIAVVILFLLI